MTKITRLSTATFGAMFALSLHAASAQAAPRTWVSSTGSGTTCSRAAPCATFQAAHDATNAGGVIGCIDAADYGVVAINRAISIVCDNTGAGILMSTTGSAIFIQAGPNDIITLKGIDIDGNGIGNRGIGFFAGGSLHVHKVSIRNHRDSGNFVAGIYFNPNSYSELYVADSIISDNGLFGTFSGGIVIAPSGSASVNAFINRVQLENNSTGVLVDGTQSTGVAVNATVLNSSLVGGIGDGVHAKSSAGHAAVSVFVDHSVASGNFGSGLRAVGDAASGAGSALVRFGDSTVVLNQFGVSSASPGVVQSFKNNRISGNLNDGTPVPAYAGPGGTPLQ